MNFFVVHVVCSNRLHILLEQQCQRRCTLYEYLKRSIWIWKLLVCLYNLRILHIRKCGSQVPTSSDSKSHISSTALCCTLFRFWSSLRKEFHEYTCKSIKTPYLCGASKDSPLQKLSSFILYCALLNAISFWQYFLLQLSLIFQWKYCQI